LLYAPFRLGFLHTEKLFKFQFKQQQQQQQQKQQQQQN